MAHAENRPVSRAAALGCLLLAASLALTGCSSKDSKPDAKAPASRAASAGKPTSAPGAAATASSTAGTVTAASLSDTQLGYTVTVIPAGLDAKRVAILQDFVAYDQMSWKLWVGGGQDTSKVPTVTTGNLQQQLINDASTLQNTGQKAKTPVKVAISEGQDPRQGRDLRGCHERGRPERHRHLLRGPDAGDVRRRTGRGCHRPFQQGANPGEEHHGARQRRALARLRGGGDRRAEHLLGRLSGLSEEPVQAGEPWFQVRYGLPVNHK